MALGGYKFAGYKYTRPADYDSSVDAQVLAEVLKMHKCKLKAFTESCAASGAQWDFSYNAGDYAFGTHGNVIYKLDSSGFNLVSFFRYGTDDAYYAIVTLSDATTQANTSYPLQVRNYYRAYSTNTVYRTPLTNDMSCISLIDLNMDNINIRPVQDMTALSSCNNGQTGSGSDYTAPVAKTSAIPEKRYYGFAVKGKNIISAFCDNAAANVFVFKISAIDALRLSSPSDTKNLFSYTILSGKTAGTVYVYTSRGYIQSLTSSGECYEACSTSGTSYTTTLFVRSPLKAITINPTDNIPYESAVISTTISATRPAGNTLNVDGIISKGEALIDLMATNLVYPYEGIDTNTAYANGNYLCVAYVLETSTNATNAMCGKIFYCGWDPSNPDITQESAWTEYTE